MPEVRKIVIVGPAHPLRGGGMSTFNERMAKAYADAGEDVPSTYEAALKHRDGTRIDVEFNASVISFRGKPAAFAIIREILLLMFLGGAGGLSAALYASRQGMKTAVISKDFGGTTCQKIFKSFFANRSS